MSDEQLVKDVFRTHKCWVEEGLEQSKESAKSCDLTGVLQNFYRAILALKGLETVFKVDVPEVQQYTQQKKQDIIKKDIPEIVSMLETRCRIKKL